MSAGTGFRVQSVEIEGFKGFASPQEVDFKGRHVFLLGRNGNGKSSIVEAVRWGLFGSANRPNEVIKNQHYSGDCRVTVKLARDGQLWTLRRTLNLGAGSSSEAILTDQAGNKQPIGEIMPQLDSVNSGEGTHIIFAAQSEPLRRQSGNLGPFERTIFSYLGLTYPRMLLSELDEFLENQESVEGELGGELTDIRTALDRRIEEERSRRRNILNISPWGNQPVPSIVDSERKIRQFIGEIGDDEASDGLALEDLLEYAKQSLDDRHYQDQDSLEDEARDLTAYRGSLETLRDARAQTQLHEDEVKRIESRLTALCGERTIDELTGALIEAQDAMTTASIRDRITEDALELLRRTDAEAVRCPICSVSHPRSSLREALKNGYSGSGSSEGSRFAELSARVDEAQSLKSELAAQKERRIESGRAAAAAVGLLRDTDKDRQAEVNGVELLIEHYRDRESEIDAQISDGEDWFDGKSAELDRFAEEVRLHRIQKRLNTLEAHKNELERVIESYEHLVEFGKSVREIRGVAASTLNNQLAQEIPRVSQLLSQAFVALTQHPWYDHLVIAKSMLPKLELRVVSSRDSDSREDPTGVLNGQAESALHLVPYFAFGQANDTPTEVYLVMLDDPTRALDTEHIKILVQRLRELADSVQLIVASQETERLLEMVPNIFDEDSYTVVEPASWLPDRGPILAVEYG